MEQKSGGSGAIIAVVILILVAVVGWLAYNQGFFSGKTQDDTSGGLEINIGGTSEESGTAQ